MLCSAFWSPVEIVIDQSATMSDEMMHSPQYPRPPGDTFFIIPGLIGDLHDVGRERKTHTCTYAELAAVSHL
jgi:hypothetical protein